MSQDNVKDHTAQYSPDIMEVKSQYLKDCSFENPNAPQSFKVQQQPKIGVGINLNAAHLGENEYEVTLHLEAHAEMQDKDSLFLASVEYCGVFAVSEQTSEDELQLLLLVEAPALLFPYARHIIADMTREGGFPALSIANVDFARLYQEKKAEGQIDKVGKAPKKGQINGDVKQASKALN